MGGTVVGVAAVCVEGAADAWSGALSTLDGAADDVEEGATAVGAEAASAAGAGGARGAAGGSAVGCATAERQIDDTPSVRLAAIRVLRGIGARFWTGTHRNGLPTFRQERKRCPSVAETINPGLG
jgi:hypothetical protein